MKQRLLILFTVILLASACSGLAGDVQIVVTLTPLPAAAAVAQVVEDAGYPSAVPNLTSGAAVFAENCTACHGINGNGQGDLVLSGQVGAMTSFLDTEAMRDKTPDSYFQIITNGNLEKLMPPWKDALTEQQRWDVAHYVLMLHYTPAQIALGQQLYEMTCLECHGVTGAGDGEKQRAIGAAAYDLTYWRDMAFVSDNDIMDVIRLGKGDVMPAQQGKLSDDQMAAITAYTRSFSTTREDAPSQTEPETASASDSNTFSISGMVTNGTAGGSVPPDLRVYLNYGNPTDGIQTLETTTDTAGRYQFQGVPRVLDSAYFVYTSYQNLSFGGEVRQTADIANTVDIPVVIYENSDDTALVSLTALDTLLEPFPPLQDATLGAGLLVTQTLTFTNQSDRAFVLSQGGRSFSLLLPLPPGAIALNAINDPRFIVAQEQFSVIYTQAVLPGDTPIELIYFWPYENGAVFDQTLNYDLRGTSSVTTRPKSLRLTSADWTLDDSAPFVSQYTRTAPIERGQSFKFDLVGSVNDTTSDDAGLITGDTLIPIIAGMVMVVMAGLVVYSLVIRRQPKLNQQLLVRQIADLDSLHERGLINHDAYQRQRQTLRNRLTLLMASQRADTDS